MSSFFPGMDPYLENPALWPNVHGRLIVAIADVLSLQLLPKYQPIVEEAVYRTTEARDKRPSVLVGIPDVAIEKTTSTADVVEQAVAVAEPLASPVVVELPVPATFRQRFIEIRNTANQEVVTAIEVLSPTNKRGEGRSKYQEKRSRILESQVNLVEIDLLHRGKPMPLVRGNTDSHYRILVSSTVQRPQALSYPFNLAQPLPQVSIPLRKEDSEPVVDFQELLSQIYDRSGYAFSIDYSLPPEPSWNAAELAWIEGVCAGQAAT